MIKEVKKSKLIAKTNGDIIRLQSLHEVLVSLSIEDRKEDLVLTYNLDNLLPFSEIEKELPLNRLKALINIARLAELTTEYIIDLSPANIYYDMNYLPKMLDRDVCNEDCFTEHEDFINQYKSLIGCTLQNKYKFEDYYLGGLDLMKKDSRMKAMYSCNKIEELVDLLKKEYEKESSNLHIKSVVVPKSKLRFHRVIEGIAIFGVLLLGFYGGYNYFVTIPYHQKLMDANNYFIHHKYDKVISVMAETSLDHIPVNTKYVLVHSYYNENKTLLEQSEAKLDDISTSSEVDYYNYWIECYRGNYEEAIDTAKKIQNDDYLLYAYNQQYNEVAEDNNLDGEEKQTKLDALKTSIKSLETEMEEESKNDTNQATNSK